MRGSDRPGSVVRRGRDARPRTAIVVAAVLSLSVVAACGDDPADTPAPTGTAAATGTTGTDGVSGSTGVSGTTGVSGATGMSGSTGASGSLATADATVQMRAGEMFFDPNALSFPAGSTVAITMHNEGLVEHDLVVEQAGFRLDTASGATATMVLSVPAAGTYEFYCSLPGHREAGMVGTLTATEA